MATGGGREPRAGSAEPAGERRVPEEPRRVRDVRELLVLLELRQQRLRSRIAACEELMAAMAAQRPGPAEP